MRQEAQAPFAPCVSQAGHHETGGKGHCHRNTDPDKYICYQMRLLWVSTDSVSLGLLYTQLPWDTSTQFCSPGTRGTVYSYVLQVLSCPSITSVVFSSMDWTTPIPSFSPHGSCLLNHQSALFSSRFLPPQPHFLVVLLFLKAVSRKLLHDSSWDPTKLSCIERSLHPLACKPQLAFFTTVWAWWLTVSMESTTKSSPFSTVLLPSQPSPFCIRAALYSHLSLQLCAYPFLNHLLLSPGDLAHILNPNPAFQ